jgi:hypothetical protein
LEYDDDEGNRGDSSKFLDEVKTSEMETLLFPTSVTILHFFKLG